MKAQELTLEQAVEVLNKNNHRRCANWEPDDGGPFADQVDPEQLWILSKEGENQYCSSDAKRLALSYLQEEEIKRLQGHLENFRQEIEQQRRKAELFDELLPAVAQVMDHKADKKGIACCYEAIDKLKEVWKKAKGLSR